MKRFRWQIVLGVSLFVTSIFFYLLHYVIFKDAHHIFLYMIGDFGFLAIQVLFVTLIVDQLLSTREKRAMMEKMNMVIGTFFSEVGTDLMRAFFEFDRNVNMLRDDLAVRAGWTERDFNRAARHIKNVRHEIDSRQGNLEFLRSFLIGKRTFMLRLLENPILLEHDSFTHLLWAVFHVKDELASRDKLVNLPENDLDHLSEDIHRAYNHLIAEWIEYMRHLKKDYPYLFSLAVRTNPFDTDARVEIA
ncbi:MAG: hypothetical protein GTN70_05695 [Deltaproteobacteria bacterium]|nr:hypothetical protein [Deltaproteobacteria bacterium]NIS77173.1 hypothetical protein [Deltaproteobacteria bacterium]